MPPPNFNSFISFTNQTSHFSSPHNHLPRGFYLFFLFFFTYLRNISILTSASLIELLLSKVFFLFGWGWGVFLVTRRYPFFSSKNGFYSTIFMFYPKWACMFLLCSHLFLRWCFSLSFGTQFLHATFFGSC